MQIRMNQPQESKQDASSQDPYKWHALGFAALIGITPVCLLTIAWLGTSPTPAARSTDAQTSFVSHISSGGVPSILVSGASVYKNTCAVCHGADGQGVARLGKPLRNSAYVQSASDEQLFDLIANGRLPDDPENSTGTLMPARGAQNIDDDRIEKVITYLHEMQDPNQPTSNLDDWDLKAQMLASAGTQTGDVHPGRDIFIASCSACHGASGEGIEGLGKSFVTSEFVNSSSDKELLTMIKMGRPIWDAANTTGIDMPPKGGNPALTDDQFMEIIGYIRSVSSLED